MGDGVWPSPGSVIRVPGPLAAVLLEAGYVVPLTRNELARFPAERR